MRFINPSARIGLLVASFIAAAMATTGCVAPTPGTGEDQSEVLSTNLSAYMSGSNIIVNYTGMQGSDQSDWIAIAHPTDADNVYETFQYTGGAKSGTMTFTAPDLENGTYEARAYYDWQHTFSYTIEQTSPTFTVSGGAQPTVTTDMAAYPSGSTVTLEYSNLPGNKYDYVAVATAGAPTTSVLAWDYTNGAVNGTQAFTGLASGNYEARAYRDNTYDELASSTFTILGATTIKTDETLYAVGATVTVTWKGMPGNATDYVAVALASSPPGTNVGSASTGGAVNGSTPFTGLAVGSYVARAYLGGTTTILATYSFSVAASTATTLTTDSTTYAVGQPVTATFTNSGANSTDQIGIAVAGSPDSAYVAWKYTGGTVNGSVQFTGLPAGTYQARFYPAASDDVSARSPNFTIAGSLCTTPTESPVLDELLTGDLTIGSGSQTVSAALTIDPTTSILFTTISEDEKSPDYGAVICELGSAGVTCIRNDAGTDESTSTGTIQIHYTVATFTSGVSVQRGVVNTATADPTDVTLTSIDPSSSFIVLGGQSNGGTGWGNNEFINASIVNSTTLQIGGAVASTAAAWQVVTMTGASVQRGSASFATGDTAETATITAAPSGSMVLASYTTDNASGVDASEMMMQASLANATTIDFSRVTGGTNLAVSWEVVSLPFATHTGTASFAAGVTTATVSIPGIAVATSFAIGNSQAILGQACGSTTYAGADGDLVGEACASMSTGSGSLTLTRTASQSASTIPWTVIDFAHNCAGD